MPAYKVVLPSGASTTLGGNNAMVVFAGNTTDAKAVAAAYSDQDAAPWDQATVTQLDEDASFAGLRVVISIAADDDNGFDADVVVTYDVPSDTTADTVDEIGDLLAAALNATPELSGVTYTSASDTLTIVEGNNCGLSAITAKVYQLGADSRTGYFENTSMALTVGAVGGDASSDRTIVITPLSTGIRASVFNGYKTGI